MKRTERAGSTVKMRLAGRANPRTDAPFLDTSIKYVLIMRGQAERTFSAMVRERYSRDCVTAPTVSLPGKNILSR